MTQDEIKAIEEIKGTAGFRVIEFILQQALDKLDSISDMDFDQPNIEAKAIGRGLAVKWCKDISEQINLSAKAERDNKRTYE